MIDHGPNTEARLAVHLKNAHHRVELTDGRLQGITTHEASSNYLMTCELQLTLEPSGIEWPALRNQISYMDHIKQLALGAFMSSLGVKHCMKFWEVHEHNP